MSQEPPLFMYPIAVVVMILLFGGIGKAINSIHDRLIDQHTKTKWAKIGETNESTIFADVDNNNDPNSNHSNGWLCVPKDE